MIQLIRPTAAAARDPDQVFAILLALYNEALEKRQTRTPDVIPALKAITMATFADMRKLRGDSNGQLGPRCCLVAGKTVPAGAGKGAFAWDATSVLQDDDTDVLAVLGVPLGRWRRIL